MRGQINDHLLALYGGDPFAAVVRAAEEHRASHGQACGLYPAGPLVMRLVATLVRVSGATRILDIGTGFGYSALWLAVAAGAGAHVDAIDQFEEHVAAGRQFAAGAGLAERISFIAGEASAVLLRLAGPYDLIHDDGWFAAQPPYFERVVELLRPGGLLTMPNWFLLEDAVTGVERRPWAEFAGEGWAEATRTYAQRLADDPRFHITWTVSPPLGIAIRQL
jgi:predicted O-methyltransferase YrrM